MSGSMQSLKHVEPRTGDYSILRSPLKPLLRALNWNDDDRSLVEAAPHLRSVDTFDEAISVCTRLGFSATIASAAAITHQATTSSSLLCDRNGRIYALIATSAGVKQCFDDDLQEVALERLSGLGPFRIATFRSVEKHDAEAAAREADWFGHVASRFTNHALIALGLSLVVNILALAAPLYVMTVYDKVIASEFPLTLAFLLVGVLLTLSVEARLRDVRSRVIAYIGAKFDAEIACAAQSKLFAFPLFKTASTSVQSQVALLRRFDAFREMFTGHIAGAAIDLPFTLIFFVAIAVIGGPLVWIPLFVAAAFAFATWLYRAFLRQSIIQSGALRTQLQHLRLEILQKRTMILELGVEQAWLDRFVALSAKANQHKFRTQMLDNALHTTSQSMMTFAGAITLGAGALLVIDGSMTVGALIGVMIIIWRLLTPIQIMILSLSRIDALRDTVRQLNNFMKLPGEEGAARWVSAQQARRGPVIFSGVSFRLTSDSEPILRGIDADFAAGAATALVGPDSAGRSALFKVALDLYRPQLGVISIDGVNNLQIPRRALRASIAYLPPQHQFFYGTIAQNLRLANPLATDDAILRALTEAGFAIDDPLVAERNDLRLDFCRRDALPPRVKQQLALARVYVKESSLYFLDEPDRYLDARGVEALIAKIGALKASATLLVASNNPIVVRACDRAVIIGAGRVVGAGPAVDIAAKLENSTKQAAA